MRCVEAVTHPREVHLALEVPETWRERMRGLLGRERLRPGSGFLFERTRSVHTVGMRFPILVAFLDDLGTVTRIRLVRPGRVLLPRPGTRDVLECSVSEDIRAGDRLDVA